MSLHFDVDDLNPGIWVPLEEGGDEAAVAAVMLRVLDRETGEKLRTKHTKRTLDRRQVADEFDDAGYSADMWDFCICDWRNVDDMHGTAIPCTRENKLMLMGKSPYFIRLISAAMDRLSEIEADRAKSAEKN